MNNLRPSEKKFETHIEKYLNSIGFNSFDYQKYDRNFCLIKE